MEASARCPQCAAEVQSDAQVCPGCQFPLVESSQDLREDAYPFWGYLDVAGFVGIALLGWLAVQLLMTAVISSTHVKQIYVLLPGQILLYIFLLAALALIFRRYYGRGFGEALRWNKTALSTSFIALCGFGMAFVSMFTSVLIRMPDLDTPMKKLLSDPASAWVIALLGITIGPLCEEIVFRGFLQPVLVRSLGKVAGILAAAVPFGLLHLPEYGNSWRAVLLITMAGASFGWMRERSGSTRAATLMHASYNFVFFLLLVAQQAAQHGRWAGYGK